MPLTALSKLGLAKETAYGTPPSQPAVLLPYSSASFSWAFDQVVDSARRGIPVKDFHAYRGAGRVEGSLEFPVYPEEIGYFLLAILGSVETSGTGPYTHTFSLNTTSNPPSLAIWDRTGVKDYIYKGLLVNEVTFSWNAAEGFLNASVSMLGKAPEGVTSVTFPDDATSQPFLGWMADLTIGTTQHYERISEGEIRLAREVALHYGCDGSPSPSEAFMDVLEVSGRFTTKLESETDLNRYLQSVKEQVELVFTYGSGQNLKSLKFTMPRVDFGDEALELDRGGTYVTFVYGFRALYDQTTSTVIEIELKNSKESY